MSEDSPDESAPLTEAALGSWTSNDSHLCYSIGTSQAWCGNKDKCFGLILPIFFEQAWPKELRIVFYLVGLLYSFLGISIVADIFMCAIEKITSTTKKFRLASVKSDGEAEYIEVPVWNGTVANLTLMALGSSAPEILLSCIEIIGKRFEAGELGPGTIVGSAAFNLMAITAVCIVSIPKGETRRIDQFIVFGVTALFSILAYVWLIIILQWNSPNVVDLPEAIVTLALFPILVLIAFAADKQWLNFLFCKPRPDLDEDKQRQIELGTMQPVEGMLRTRDYFRNGQLDKAALVKFIKDVKKNTKLSDEEAAILAASKIIDSKPHSRLWYRIGAVRSMSGGRKTDPSAKMSQRLKMVYDAINDHPECPNLSFPDEDEEKAIVEFRTSSVAVLENIGSYQLNIMRHGRMDSTVKVRVETIDGSAVEGEDYEQVDEVVTFEPEEREKTISVGIVDDNQWEPDEEFFVKLTIIPGEDSENVRLGKTCIMEITILNDDEPGVVHFEKRGYLVKESCGDAEICVVRGSGADGGISVKWETESKTAVDGKDYKGGSGTVEFKHGETQQVILIPIVNDMAFEKDENFLVRLFGPEGGAKIGKVSRTMVTITNDDDFNSVLNRMMLMTNMNVDAMKVQNETWAQQLKDAMNVNGGDTDNASTLDYVMHFLTFGFKIIFALIPPAGMAGGWPCFFLSLGMIGILTAIVGDLAGIFGCLVGLKPGITAITFVALGTSLPDTFASRLAAIGEKSADNAIGNITGSNSVNVFLGLGLPWLMAASYHHHRGSIFNVPSGDLGFSVTIYAICAVVTIALLLARRKLAIFGSSELGGPVSTKYASSAFLIFLWFLYILLSSLQAYNIISSPF